MIKVNKSTTLEDFYRQLGEGFPMLFGREVDVTTTATFAAQKAPHGLGRPYRGAVQMHSTDSLFLILPPEAQTDPEINVSFIDAIGAAGTTRLWVF